MRTFSSLVGRRVETASGLSLGRCHDLRVEAQGARLEVVALCVGRLGILDRLGIKSPGHDEVAWSSIVRIEGKRIVVRDP
jgi:sporulation protein YlmC with PRC-barrel domain